MRPFAVYPASFDGSTLGHWRFGERGGSLVDVVNGKVLTNFGADPLDEGYRFVRPSGDYMTSAFSAQPARTQLTLEGWVRNVSIIRDMNLTLLGWWTNDNNYVMIRLWLATVTTGTIIQAYGLLGGVGFMSLMWTSADLEAIVVAPRPWHFAVSMDNAGSPKQRLFVNGVQKHTGSGAIAWPAENYTFTLGKDPRGAYYYFGGILDEVRLSASARYAANFSIARFQDGRRAVRRGPELHAGLCAGAIQ